jgi:ABC-type uncharacterized transport system auxiliary subunit
MMRASLAPVLLLLGGCISLLPEPPPPPRVFVLEAADVGSPADAARVDAVIAVSAPTGERSILGTDLVWRTGDELAYVSQTQWSTRAEFALQSMLVETLSRQGLFNAATRSGEGRANYEIRWEVLDFEVAQDTMTARFVADVRLVASPGRHIIAQRLISSDAPVSERSSSSAAQALARAARQASAEIGVFAAQRAAEAELTREADQPSAASNNR